MESNKNLVPEVERPAHTSGKDLDPPQRIPGPSVETAVSEGPEHSIRPKEGDAAAEKAVGRKKESTWAMLKKLKVKKGEATSSRGREGNTPAADDNNEGPAYGEMFAEKASLTAITAQEGDKKSSTIPGLKKKLRAFAADKKKLGTIIGTLVCVAILAFGAFALSGTSGMTREMKDAAKSRNTLTVGVMNTSYPPFLYQDYNGKYTGTDMDLITAVCAYYGWEPVLKPIDWTTRSTALDTGEVDCLWSGFNSFGREENYAWTDAYLDTSDVIVVKSGNKDIKGIDDLENKTVAAVKDSNAYYSLESIGMALSRMGCEDAKQAVQMVASGNADAVVMARQEAEKLTGVKILDECLNYNTYAVACRTDNTVLRDLIGYALAQVQG